MIRIKSSFAIAIFLPFCLLSSLFPLQAKGAPPESGLLSGVLFRLEQSRDDAAARIAKAEETIAAARSLIEKAGRENNARAQQIANQALNVALMTREKAQARKAQIEDAIARVRALAEGQNSGNCSAVVTGDIGRVDYFSKRLNLSMPLSDKRAGLLEPGDEIVTHDGSRAELMLLGGRASLCVGENSKVKIEEDGYGNQAINMSRGKIYVGVAKLQEYENMIKEGIDAYKRDAATVGAAVVEGMVDKYEQARDLVEKWSKRKFSVRTPTAVCGVRGTRFLVSTDEEMGTGVVVLEGAVEVIPSNGAGAVQVEAGHTIHVSNDGAIGAVEPTDGTKLEKWWPNDK